MAQGNDCARGFMRGTGARHDGWAELVNDEERGGSDPDDDALPRARRRTGDAPQSDQPRELEKVIVHMAAGLSGAYQYFRSHRQVSPTAHTSEPRHNVPKVGRTLAARAAPGRSTSSAAAGRA